MVWIQELENTCSLFSLKWVLSPELKCKTSLIKYPLTKEMYGEKFEIEVLIKNLKFRYFIMETEGKKISERFNFSL